ncbi:hypothetical protein [Pseudoflavonifractor sp. 524-17]|uniref:hypothetical protein n=1 Tax=Pseudoflavonifractor sp. 524-17 TaxID=2304577 RepID=UPI00137AA7F0|nr:hypothetical protein [Pseudoflavonifractor sp. 524-17]
MVPVLLLAYAPGDSLPLPLEFFAGLFLWGFAGGACWLVSDWSAVSARIFSREFFTKKAPENFGPLWAVVFRRCCFHRRGELAAGGPAPGPLPRRSAFFHGDRAEYRPHFAAKISSDFSGEVFYARGQGLVSWYINAPYSPPRLEKIHWKFWRQPRRKNSRFRRFCQKPPGNFG